MSQSQDPRLQEIVEVKNDIALLDVDITIETTLDTPNIQQEQFELMANIAQGRSEIPFASLLRLSSLRDKDKIIEEIEADQKAQAEAQAQQAEVATRLETAKAVEKEAKAQNIQAQAAETAAKTEQIKSETALEAQTAPLLALAERLEKEARMLKDQAAAKKLEEEALNTEIQNKLLIITPPKDTGVII